MIIININYIQYLPAITILKVKINRLQIFKVTWLINHACAMRAPSHCKVWLKAQCTARSRWRLTVMILCNTYMYYRLMSLQILSKYVWNFCASTKLFVRTEANRLCLPFNHTCAIHAFESLSDHSPKNKY